MKSILRLIIFLCMIGLYQYASAGNLTLPNTTDARYPDQKQNSLLQAYEAKIQLDHFVEYAIDKNNSISIEKLVNGQSTPNWKTGATKTLNSVYISEPVWLRFSVKTHFDQSLETVPWILEIMNPFLPFFVT